MKRKQNNKNNDLQLNLKKCENTPINIEGKGISGGEKRRLAFASEVILLIFDYLKLKLFKFIIIIQTNKVLTDPMILFCGM